MVKLAFISTTCTHESDSILARFQKSFQKYIRYLGITIRQFFKLVTNYNKLQIYIYIYSVYFKIPVNVYILEYEDSHYASFFCFTFLFVVKFKLVQIRGGTLSLLLKFWKTLDLIILYLG